MIYCIVFFETEEGRHAWLAPDASETQFPEQHTKKLHWVVLEHSLSRGVATTTAAARAGHPNAPVAQVIAAHQRPLMNVERWPSFVDFHGMPTEKLEESPRVPDGSTQGLAGTWGI